MPTPLPAPAIAPLLATLILGSAIGFALLVTRATHRSSRRRRRSNTGELVRMLGARLSGQLPSSELRRVAKETESQAFWDAIEAIAASLRLRERYELARSLDRSRHVREARRVLREDDNETRRETAARHLGMLPSRRSRNTLRRALVAGPELVTFAAARALGAHRDTATLRWLLLHPERVGSRPLGSLSGLFRAFGPAGRALLVAALERRLPQARVECALMDALGLSRCRSARGAIEQRLVHTALECRIAAARSLGRLAMLESTPALMHALQDEAWPVRAQAAQALGRLRATPAVDELVRCVADRSWWVRHHAAYALAVIGPEGRDALCDLVTRSPDPYAREMAREALDRGWARRSA